MSASTCIFLVFSLIFSVESFVPFEKEITNWMLDRMHYDAKFCDDTAANQTPAIGAALTMNSVSILLWNGNTYKSFILKDAVDLIWNSPEFMRTKNVTIYTNGFFTYPVTSDVEKVAANFKTRGLNFLQFDTGRYLQSDYFVASGLAPYLGYLLGMFLTNLYIKGVSPSNINLVGFSLGAQVNGYAARNFRNIHNIKLNRVTSLDPATPCFIHRPNDYVNINDATFVDVIHTSLVSLRNVTTGHAEFVVNSRLVFQPGCLELFICTHTSSIRYFADTVLNEKVYPAKKCTNLESANIFACTPDEVYMGYGLNPATRGVYYVKTGFI